MSVLRHAAATIAIAALWATPAFAQNLNTSANGSYGRVTLEAGFTPDPHTVSLNAGGALDASQVAGENCVGMIAQRPDFSLRYQAGQLPLFISATSESDTTLVVRAPSGAFLCDDDGGAGVNPAVHIPTPERGRYQIWVGTYSAGAGNPVAALHISEIGSGAEPGQGPNFALPPTFGEIALASGFLPDPHTVAIQAGGNLDASMLSGQGVCVGSIAQAPDYRVNFTAGTSGLPLIFSAAADSDTTLVVNSADGTWYCDDDGGNEGLNPSISFETPMSGQYDVWVGTYSPGAIQSSTLSVSELYSE